jgi:hypothetical protein
MWLPPLYKLLLWSFCYICKCISVAPLPDLKLFVRSNATASELLSSNEPLTSLAWQVGGPSLTYCLWKSSFTVVWLAGYRRTIWQARLRLSCFLNRNRTLIFQLTIHTYMYHNKILISITNKIHRYMHAPSYKSINELHKSRNNTSYEYVLRLHKLSSVERTQKYQVLLTKPSRCWCLSRKSCL